MESSFTMSKKLAAHDLLTQVQEFLGAALDDVEEIFHVSCKAGFHVLTMCSPM